MARFNAAKMFNAIDKKFQEVYNQLIDLLDTGYNITSIIGGKKVNIDINTKEGISISIDGVKVFGVDTNGNVFASRLSTNSYPNIYGIVGYDAVTGTSGISLFDSDVQSNYCFSIKHGIWGGSGNDSGVIMDDGARTVFLQFTRGETTPEDNSISLFTEPANGLSQVIGRFLATHTYTEIQTQDDVVEGQTNTLGIDKDGMYFDKYLTRFQIIDIPGSKMELTCPSVTNNSIGVDATGAYKITGGVKTYL